MAALPQMVAGAPTMAPVAIQNSAVPGTLATPSPPSPSSAELERLKERSRIVLAVNTYPFEPLIYYSCLVYPTVVLFNVHSARAISELRPERLLRLNKRKVHREANDVKI